MSKEWFEHFFVRMDLFFEKPEQTEAVLLATELKMEDPENFIYTINGVDAYGISKKKSILFRFPFNYRYKTTLC